MRQRYPYRKVLVLGNDTPTVRFWVQAKRAQKWFELVRSVSLPTRLIRRRQTVAPVGLDIVPVSSACPSGPILSILLNVNLADNRHFPLVILTVTALGRTPTQSDFICSYQHFLSFPSVRIKLLKIR